MPTAEWLKKYEAVKEKLACKTDLDAYFTEKAIGNMDVAVLDIGAAHAWLLAKHPLPFLSRCQRERR